jgi:hypothetical protein
VVLALALAACADPAPSGPSKEQIKQSKAHWLALSRCLLGAPLAEGTKASDALRMVDLSVVASGASNDGDWTRACDDVAGRMIDHVATYRGDAGDDPASRLVKTLEELRATRPDMLAATAEPVIDRLWQAARDAGVEPIGEGINAAEGPTAPEPSHPMNAADLSKLGVSKGYIERSEMAPAGSVRILLGSKGKGAFFCHIESRAATLNHARCTTLTADVGVAATPLSAEGEDAAFYWDADPKPAAWRLGGDRIDIPVSPSAFVFADGTVADVVPQRRDGELIRQLSSGRVERAPVRAPPGGELLGHRAGALLWRGPLRGASGKRGLTVQDVQPGRVGLGGAIEVGEVPRDVKHMLACRTSDAVHLVLIGEDPKAGAARDERGVSWVTRRKKRWQKPVNATVDFGEPIKPWTEDWWRTLACDDGGATLTWLRADRRIGRMRCDKEGCAALLSETIAPLSPTEKLRVASVGANVLFLRTVRAVAPLSGLTDLVAMRMAPLAEISSAKDQVLVADEKYGGVPDLHKSLGLIAAGDAAVALIHSGENVYGLRIDAKGNYGKLALGAAVAPAAVEAAKKK